jgi:hypothetical protein
VLHKDFRPGQGTTKPATNLPGRDCWSMKLEELNGTLRGIKFLRLGKYFQRITYSKKGLIKILGMVKASQKLDQACKDQLTR